MIWVGLDLHKKYITACAMDEAGGIVAEHRRLLAAAGAIRPFVRAVASQHGTSRTWPRRRTAGR